MKTKMILLLTLILLVSSVSAITNISVDVFSTEDIYYSSNLEGNNTHVTINGKIPFETYTIRGFDEDRLYRSMSRAMQRWLGYDVSGNPEKYENRYLYTLNEFVMKIYSAFEPKLNALQIENLALRESIKLLEKGEVPKYGIECQSYLNLMKKEIINHATCEYNGKQMTFSSSAGIAIGVTT